MLTQEEQVAQALMRETAESEMVGSNRFGWDIMILYWRCPVCNLRWFEHDGELGEVVICFCCQREYLAVAGNP